MKFVFPSDIRAEAKSQGKGLFGFSSVPTQGVDITQCNIIEDKLNDKVCLFLMLLLVKKLTPAKAFAESFGKKPAKVK